MATSKCVGCGQPGHWARSCTNPPDDYALRRQKGTGGGKTLGGVVFQSSGPEAGNPHSGSECAECIPQMASQSNMVTFFDQELQEQAPQPGGDSFVFMQNDIVFTNGTNFIALCLTPGLALLDTGAQ